ncbi:NUMOD4 domain-containing protein [Solitalea canadensis]|uniref:NUMOD4 motif protein n=1 Tax=Solitalea canadensis (strain ATCC 29591 / DSM 3403 / JCM 21819 / LMG 8368 / NBRC 15130 / NCIMB 12057 / USAM 9D) TaxID=929556 RepID=H8KTY7_SOLCM|nr:NUMOD4 domain-containing protein [Solitalea canadensis]AFD06837.1 NUMOD4 motif protein [Solitalea canadensis DSM 3403]
MPQQQTIEPYLDRSLIDRIDEVWKDIPGFEGFYQVSNQGRVKSLDRTVEHPRLYSQFVKGQVLRHSIAKNLNIKTGEPMIDLRVCLNKYGKSYYFNTRRIVYATFIDPTLDFTKDGMYVINANGNGYDCSVGNLKLASKSEKQQRVIKRDRHHNYLAIADRSGWTKAYGGATRRKPIDKYSLEGELIASYESISQASKLNSLDEKSIIAVAKGRYRQWNGFIWKYSTDMQDK